MNDQELEKIIREYIDKTVHMSLATVSADRPWVCEVHFTYDDDLNLYFRSTPARRHSQEIEDNPHVAGNIVDTFPLDDPRPAVGIYFEGTAEQVEDESLYDEIYELFERRLDVNESIIDDAKRADGHKFYKISVQNWYAFGRFGDSGAKKHELAWNGGEK
ncbi:MAG TPA: pyridoxamine 5'-phosphate oxidase family protein [Candidatus Saccharimonadales bacterium]